MGEALEAPPPSALGEKQCSAWVRPTPWSLLQTHLSPWVLVSASLCS